MVSILQSTALLSRSMEGYYVVLKNLYLPMKGKTTEIDLLMIHEKEFSFLKAKITVVGFSAVKTS